MGKNKIIFNRRESFIILAIFIFAAGLLFTQKIGRIYSVNESKKTYLTGNIPSSQQVFKSLPKETLLLVDGKNKTSLEAKQGFQQILKDMRMGYEVVDISKETLPKLTDYQKVVVLIPTLDRLKEKTEDLLTWVLTGGQMLFGVTLSRDERLAIISQKLGIEHFNYDTMTVKSIFISKDFMLGGGKAYTVDPSLDSSNPVSLSEDSKVYAWTGGEVKNPLIWEKSYGKGKFVMTNFGIYNKAVRGLYAASYSLLTEATVYPVINGSAHYLDDFPSPLQDNNVPYGGNNNVSVSSFFTNIWWPDMLRLTKKYGVKYTGMLLQHYDNQVDGSISPQTNIDRIKYFGDSLLSHGGEIAYQGYNHHPLNHSSIDYNERYPNYLTWKNTAAMRKAFSELVKFATDLFPKGSKSVYAPPSDILSKEGRLMLRKEFPQIKSIASSYFSDSLTYSQEFEVAKDGLIEQPRTISGNHLDNTEKLTRVSELNLHFVNNHLIHFDEVLGKTKQAKENWGKTYQKLEQHIVWMKHYAPQLRHLTGSQLAGAIQRFAILKVKQKKVGEHLLLTLNNFKDEAFLMVRLNNGKPQSVSGGKLEHLTGNLYLLKAQSSQIKIRMK